MKRSTSTCMKEAAKFISAYARSAKSSGLKHLPLAAFAILFSITQALAIQADVQPKELFSGDPFVIKVSGVAVPQKLAVLINGKEIPLGSCGNGCFLGIGTVDPQMPAGEVPVTVTAGAERASLRLSVKEAKYPEIRLNLPDRQVTLSAADLARAKKEEDRLKALWQQTTDRLFDGNFIIPLDNPVSTAFGAKRVINNKNVSIHRGIDIRGTLGEKVRAANRGIVVMAENLFFGGNTMVIDHGLGIYTVYMHLDRFAAKPGDLVSKGEAIGFVGSSGRSTGPHLHFGVKIMTFNSNPLSLTALKLE